jgi:hypothetical protein
MGALLSVVACAGGCLAVCWLMMGRTRRQPDGEPGSRLSGPRLGEVDDTDQ